MILIDNNISPQTAKVLTPIYEGIIHVVDVGLDDKEDLKIWEYAQNNVLHILTKDADFNDLQQLRGFPPKVIWLKIGNATTTEVVTLLQIKEKEIKGFLKNPSFGILEIY